MPSGCAEEPFVLELELVLPQRQDDLLGQPLIGAFAGQQLQRLQLAGDPLIAQEDFDIGGRTVPAASGEEFLEAGRTIEGGAIDQVNRRKMTAQLLSHRVGGLLEQGLVQAVGESRLEVNDGGGSVALIDGLPGDRLGQTLSLGVERQPQGAQLAENQRGEELKGVDFTLATQPLGGARQLDERGRDKAPHKLVDKRKGRHTRAIIASGLRECLM